MAASTRSASTSKINCSKFYFEWKGHPIEDLTKFHNIILAERLDKPIIYLAGDSSLDNKYWVHLSGENVPTDVPEIYEKTLKNPVPKPDVAFWMNHLLEDRATCINTAVEESMLRDRDDKLLPHDEFIRDNIRAEDVLVVSIGANDIALKPLPCTIRHMLQLAWLTQRSSLEDGSAWSLKYFKHMFGTKIQDYITRVTAKTRPRAVIVCMIYFPLEAGLGQESWADVQLKALGYNSYPSQLQTAIRAMYEIATKKIKVEGTEIVPCALHEVLDGKDAKDYTARVEPNEEGGRKMAVKFVELFDRLLEPGTHVSDQAL
ncbi:Nn.00g117380.m01.CDS01 [Neocucurbitaria sp. VM-36]